MTIRTLEFFLTVAEEGNITRASHLLHISQPTVSRDMMELEKELGKTLFIRSSRNVSLTPDGLLFRETAKDMLALYKKALQQRAGTEELAGDIYLGAGETESFSWLSDRIRLFRDRCPRACFHIISENADEICSDIDKGILDLGFIMYTPNADRYECLDLGREEVWGLLMPQGHPLSGKKSLTGGDLLSLNLILPENHTFRRQITEWLGGEPQTAATYNLIRNVLHLIQNGTGCAVCLGDPDYAELGLSFVPLVPSRTASPILIWKNRPAAAPVFHAFLQFLSNS